MEPNEQEKQELRKAWGILRNGIDKHYRCIKDDKHAKPWVPAKYQRKLQEIGVFLDIVE